MHHSSDHIVTHVSHIMAENTHHQTMSCLVVAVSGGLDSLVLLHVLAAQAHLQPFRLHVATFDHGWRAESAADVAFVQGIASAWGLPCTSGRMEAPDKTPLGREAAARAARYDFLAQVARQEGAVMVATAHHADDQVETILLHLLRGTGTAGLQGMPPLASFPGADDLRLLRPLLEISREEIASYAQRHNLTPRHDSSNDDSRYKRNALRRDIVPQLKRFNPKFTHNVLRLAAIARDEQSYLTQRLDQGLLAYAEQMPYRWQVPRDRFWQEHIALQKRYVWQAAQTLSKTPQDVTYERIMAAVMMFRTRHKGAKIELQGGVIAYMTPLYVILEQTQV